MRAYPRPSVFRLLGLPGRAETFPTSFLLGASCVYGLLVFTPLATIGAYKLAIGQQREMDGRADTLQIDAETLERFRPLYCILEKEVCQIAHTRLARAHALLQIG